MGCGWSYLCVFDAGLQDLLLLLEFVDVGGEHINVVKQRVILLLRLDERIHDLLDIRNPGRLLDLAERVVDHLHVPLILVYHLHLLLVILVW